MHSEDVRLIWNEIDLDILAKNMKILRQNVSSKYIAAIIKADGYGHGSVGVASTLLENGATHLAVARLTEALELRHGGITAPIFLLGYVEPEGAKVLIEHDIAVSVYSYDQAVVFSREAQKLNKVARIHIVVDTGMRRIGFLPDLAAIEVIKEIYKLPNLEFEGIFTHFAKADDDKDFTDKQYNIFLDFIAELKKINIEFKIRHCANSAAILKDEKYHLDMVRAGIIMYGINPLKDFDIKKMGINPAMSFKCKITHIKKVKKGEGISYSHTYVAKADRIIATLPVGYADGYPRGLSNKGEVLIGGKKAPIVGNICMDQCMVDVTDITNLQVGDEAVLFGKQKNASILVDEIAEKIDTINYEIPCMLARRVPKYYYKDKKLSFYRYYIDAL